MVNCRNCRWWESIDSDNVLYSFCLNKESDNMKTSAMHSCKFGEEYSDRDNDEELADE